MDLEEQKEYIKKNWNTSSGKRIKEMLKRYWHNKGLITEEESDIVSIAEDLFGTHAENTDNTSVQDTP